MSHLLFPVWALAWSLSLLLGAEDVGPSLRPVALRCETLIDPEGIDVRRPGLAWRSEAGEATARGLAQSAYQIMVASSAARLAADQADLWDSGKVAASQSLQIIYAGKPLASFDRCYWRVRVWDGRGVPSAWSDTASWSMGPLSFADWGAKWIGKDGGDSGGDPLAGSSARWIWSEPGAASSAAVGVRYFRRTFTLPSDHAIRSATVRMAADDEFQLFVNGTEVDKGNDFKAPRETDVAQYLVPGANVLAVAVTNRAGPPANPAGLIGALRVELADGSQVSLVTDGRWRAQADQPRGWERPDYQDSGWTAASVLGDYGMAPWGPLGGGGEHRRLAARVLRRDFEVGKRVTRATAYVCGLGFFELYLNGQKVSDHVMDPALSNYAKHVCFVAFDVTDRVRAGANAVGVVLGNARFFAPRAQVPVATNTFGYPKLLCAVRLEYEDGSLGEVRSDESWQVTDAGPIRANSEYDGEEYDARREMPGWCEPGFAAVGWSGAQLVQAPPGELGAQMLEPMRVTQVVRAVAVTNPNPGTYLVDFGENAYGMVQLRARGPAGTRISVRTAFARKPDGTLKTEDNRSALTTDVYVMRGGGGEEVWSPRFRGQGTHFAEISGFPGVPSAADFSLLTVHTDMEKVGSFSCSNALLNAIYANSVRSMRMQNRSVPMEPDRDERQPWLGHPAKTSASEGYVYGVDGFYRHFLTQTRSHQAANGDISDAGWYWDFFWSDPIWPSVMTVVPVWLQDFYGDRSALAENYPAMKAWVLHGRSRLRPDSTLDPGPMGDWVDASSMDAKGPDSGSTSPALIATAYFYHNCRLTARAAALLGNAEDAKDLGQTADRVAAAFTQRFFAPATCSYESRTQFSYVLPLAFGLVDEEHRARVVAGLVDDILVKHQGHLTVGLLGMQWMMEVLTDIGRPDVAYTIATQTSRPSWGYMISRGATSIWERWDQDTRDPSMNGESQMILSGDLVAWMYQTLAGIAGDPHDQAFHHILLHPRIVGDLTWARASFNSPYGPILSDWRLDGEALTWQVDVPPNTTATVFVPAEAQADALENGRPLAQSPGVTFLRRDEGALVYEVGSGRYRITCAHAHRMSTPPLP